MFERIIYHLVQVRSYLMLAIAAGVLISVLSTLIMKNFQFRSRLLGIYGLLYKMSPIQMLSLVLELNRFIYVTFLILSGRSLMKVDFYILIGFILLQLFTMDSILDMLSILINGAILTGGIYICTALRAYIDQLFNGQVYQPVYLMLIVFLELYTLLVFMLNLRKISDFHRILKQIDKNTKKRIKRN